MTMIIDDDDDDSLRVHTCANIGVSRNDMLTTTPMRLPHRQQTMLYTLPYRTLLSLSFILPLSLSPPLSGTLSTHFVYTPHTATVTYTYAHTHTNVMIARAPHGLNANEM